MAGSLAARHIRAVFATSRIVRQPENTDAFLEAHHPLIAAAWHGQFLLLPMIRPDTTPARGMVARHTDAEMIGRALLHFDMELIRGAGAGLKGKDRGGAHALRAALKTLNEGASVVMTADVPPGPARVAGLGIVTLARLSGRPIVPLAIATSRFLALRTWSRLTINLPFSKLAVIAGDPIHVPRELDAEALEAYRRRVEDALNEVTERAYALAGSDAKKVAPPVKTVQKSGLLLKVYRGVTQAARPASPLLLNRRLASGKECPERLGERRGHPGIARPAGPLWWFHAASVGETNAILPLIGALKARQPHLNILLTTMTVTSARLAEMRLPKGALHQFVPLDSPVFVRRFLRHWQPDLALFTESEIWPNLIVEAADFHAPLVLLNARMSPRSYKTWRRLRSLSRPVFSRFDLVLAQDGKIAKRLTDLGARQAIVTGNLKYDAPPPPADARKLQVLRAAIGERPVFLAASTHPGEEDIIARVHNRLKNALPEILTIIVPRHPERGAALGEMMVAQGITVARRSAGELVSDATGIYIADTIGELGLFYSLAPVAFIGGSLIPHGGQNPLEAIKLGSGVLSGPHVFNFAETYRALAQENGFKSVSGEDDLFSSAVELFTDADIAAEMKANAQVAVNRLGGALQKTLDALETYVGHAPALAEGGRSGAGTSARAPVEANHAA